MLGLETQANYAAANSGLIGLFRTIALEGEKYGIKANLLNPDALIAGESSPFVDQILGAWGGRFARSTVITAKGWVSAKPPTAEDVIDHWGEIVD